MKRNPDDGFFVAIDGIDGTGKGGAVRRAVDFLSLNNVYGPRGVVQTKEPGGTIIGEQIRNVLFGSPGTHVMAPGVPDLLFLASHMQNLHQLVIPSVVAGKAVVTDRWWYSQEAYARLRHVPHSIEQAYKFNHGFDADLFIFLHGDVKTAYARANARTTESHQQTKVWNDVAKLTAIQEAYFQCFSNQSEFVPICIDNRTEQQVLARVDFVLANALQKRKKHDS